MTAKRADVVAPQDRGDGDDAYGGRPDTPAPIPWHNKTPAVLGASALGLAAIGIVVAAIMFVARDVSEPTQAPLNFVEPTFSVTATSGPSTTPTLTSTVTVSTTEINPPTTSGSETSGSEITTRAPRTKEDSADGADGSATNELPTLRTNVTRTFPRPVN